ncbi:UDP-glycosyltransferase UGT5-like isoform X1 [Leguminivora glycinivorella]|uniref:UDP-glycosyltransferase UGT5-like isoform X1 n=1 Tax=Leguminivora glycinivorella TaxID=1035111 RepID=UPI00200DDB41|nr:UDP-glycosyltransferase UGT5-like isoform X1 [Leguminivora glycinivorella]
MKIKVIYLLTFFVTFKISDVCSLKILAVNPYQGKSHYFVFQPLLIELAKRGHHVTSISYFPLKQNVANFTDISLAGSVKILEDVFPIERSYKTVISIGLFLASSGTDNCREMLRNEEVQNLWKSRAKFDVILVEQFQSDCSLGLAHELGAPVVGLTSHTPMPWHFDRVGMPYNPAYVPFMFFDGGTKPSLYQRLEAIVFNAYFNTLYKYILKTDQNTLAEYFEDVPPLEDLARDMKFLLLYKNPVLFGSSLIPENVKEINGYHVAAPRPLSGELKKFIEEAEHGVLYISFGSMLRATSTPRDKLEAIIGAVSQLPQRVVFKWEESDLPGNPKNIYVSNWLPQNDILAHPNVKAFYSHCGLLGTTEAIHHGVPVLGMPIFGDQPSNAAAVEESGLGLRIDITTLTKEELLSKLKIILDPEFRRKVKRISEAWHDRPMSAMDSAIYWIEYAVRNKDFNFRSPAADLPLYKYFNLDVLAIFTFIFYALIYVVKRLFSLRKTQSNKLIKKSKKA